MLRPIIEANLFPCAKKNHPTNLLISCFPECESKFSSSFPQQYIQGLGVRKSFFINNGSSIWVWIWGKPSISSKMKCQSFPANYSFLFNFLNFEVFLVMSLTISSFPSFIFFFGGAGGVVLAADIASWFRWYPSECVMTCSVLYWPNVCIHCGWFFTCQFQLPFSLRGLVWKIRSSRLDLVDKIF